MKSVPIAIIAVLLAAQVVAAVRVIVRLIGTSGGAKIQRAESDAINAGLVSVIVPVLNEEHRLGPCLAGLSRQGGEVGEILVVDGGSTDATRDVIAQWSQRDSRIRHVDASPVPPDWNGKPWGLHMGARAAASSAAWILTIDADVRPGDLLVSSLLAHAERTNLRVLSAATQQQVSSSLEAPVHSSLLASLVYRYGIPGHTYTEPESVQANGQCFLIHRDALEHVGGFASVATSIVEDVTFARRCTTLGIPVGFHETEPSAALVRVEMYQDWYDTLSNWSRSLPMRDRYAGAAWRQRMFDLVLTMGLPIPLLVLAMFWKTMPNVSLVQRLNVVLMMMRLGTQAGMSRAYIRLPFSHWLALLIDPISVAVIFWQANRRSYQWRGQFARSDRSVAARHNHPAQ